MSETLVKHLCGLEERPWQEWNHGKSLSANGLARLLRDFGIRPKTIRIGDHTAKGYRLEDFEDAFSRYLSDQPSPAKPSHRNNAPRAPMESGIPAPVAPDSSRNTEALVTDAEPLENPDGIEDVTAVTDGSGDSPANWRPHPFRNRRAYFAALRRKAMRFVERPAPDSPDGVFD